MNSVAWEDWSLLISLMAWLPSGLASFLVRFSPCRIIPLSRESSAHRAEAQQAELPREQSQGLTFLALDWLRIWVRSSVSHLMGRMVSQREIEVLLLEEGEMYWVDKNIKYPLPYSIEAGDTQGAENSSAGSGYRGSLGKVRDPQPVQGSLYPTWHGPWIPHGNWIPI